VAETSTTPSLLSASLSAVVCSIAIGCPDPKRAYRSDMPLVDTVIKFWRGKASRFGLLQHPITLTSQMATSATDRKATGGYCGVVKIAHTAFSLPARSCFSTTATDILQLGRCSGIFRNERVCKWGARRIAFDGRGFCRLRRGRRIVASQSPVRIFDAAAVWLLGESALRQCAQHQHRNGDSHANSLKAHRLVRTDLQHCAYLFLPEPKLGCHPAVFWLGAAAIVLIFSFFGFLASLLPFCSPLAMCIASCFHDDAVPVALNFLPRRRVREHSRATIE
jgi:hypothetical protein